MCGQPDQAGIWVSDADLSGRAREKNKLQICDYK